MYGNIDPYEGIEAIQKYVDLFADEYNGHSQKNFYNWVAKTSPGIVSVRICIYGPARTSIQTRIDLCTLRKDKFR